MKITSLVVFCVLFLFTHTALAERTVKNKAVCTNSDRPTMFSLIDDGEGATTTDGRCRDRFGNSTFHGILQTQPDESVECPDGFFGFRGIDFFGDGSGVNGSVVNHYARGNSIKSFFVNLQTCINENFEGSATYGLLTVGGEGRFESVSGFGQCKVDFDGLPGQFTGQTKCEGTLTFPH